MNTQPPSLNRSDAQAIQISPSAASGADSAPATPYVLIFSLLLSTSAMSLAWIVPAIAL